MTLRALARGSLLITAANLVPRAGAFLLLPIYARFLSQADFGTVSLAGSAALLLAITYRLGLDAALLRMHHDVAAAERGALYATLVAVSLAAAAAVTIVGVVLAPALAAGDLLPIVLLAVAIGALNTFQFVPSVWFRATDQPGRYLAIAIAGFGAVVVVTVALVVVVRLGAVGSLVGQLAGAAVMAATAFGILWRQRPWRFRADLARRGLAFGLPLLPHTLAGWLLNVSDRWLLGLLLGLAAADALAAIGVYSLGYQLGYAIALAAVSFNAAWLPFLYRVGVGPAGPGILRESTTLVIAAFTGLAAAVAILAPDLVAVIAPPDWAAAADVSVVVAFASAANAAGLMLASGIYLARDTRAMPLLTLVAAGVNVALNVALIGPLGIMGAAWATLGAYLTLAVLIGLVATRRSPLRLDLPRLGAVTAAAVGLTHVSRMTGPSSEPMAAAWHVAIVLLAAGAITLLVRGPVARLRALVATSTPRPGSTEGVG